MKILGPNPASPELELIGDAIHNSLITAPKRVLFQATVGYLSQSGIISLRSALEKTIANGGSVEIIVGLNQISKRSITALKTLHALCGGIGIFVFWNPNLRITFHPKVYIIKTPINEHLNIWIGSSNFTKLGLFSNYECNINLLLNPKVDKLLIAGINKYYSDIRNSPNCHVLDDIRLEQLAKIKGIPNGEKPIITNNAINEQLKDIFKQKPTYTMPRNSFIMTLSNNDVAGVRWEPYFLIPIVAMKHNPSFWDNPLSNTPIKIKAKITIGTTQIIENRRIYFVEGRDELRFVSPTIYKLGSSYRGSIIVIQRKKDGYQIKVINKKDPSYAIFLKRANNIASSQKLWGYI